MNPWEDRTTLLVKKGGTEGEICPHYPSCAKEERRLLNEVRDAGKDVPTTFTLSNGLRAVDFCLQYIMKNHFKRKIQFPKDKK